MRRLQNMPSGTDRGSGIWDTKNWPLVVSLGGAGALGLLRLSSGTMGTGAWLSATLAFGLLFIWPGFLLSALLFEGRTSGTWAIVPISFTVSMGLLIPLSLAVVLWHGDMRLLCILYATLVGGLTLAALGYSRRGVHLDWAGRGLSWSARSAVTIALVGIALLGVTVFVSRYVARVGTSGDQLTYLSYVRHYYSASRIDPQPPLLGQPLLDIVRLNGWLPLQALLAYAASVDPVALIWVYLPFPLMVVALLGFYSLMHELFRQHRLALLATGVRIVYYFLSTGSNEGMGRLFFYRIAESKVFVWQVLLPVILLMALRYLDSGEKGYLVALALGVAALVFSHPFGIVLVGLSLGPFIGLRWVVTRRRALFWRGIALGIVLMCFLPVPLYMSLGARAPFSLTEERIEPRENLLAGRLDIQSIEENDFVVSKQLIAHPFIVLAIVLSPLLIPFLLGDRAAQFFFATMLVPLLLMYTPGLTPAFARVTTPWQLWRVSWLLPVEGVVTFALCSLDRVVDQRASKGFRYQRVLRFITLIPLVAVVLYTLWDRAPTLSPTALESHRERISAAEEDLLTYLRDDSSVEGVVFAPLSIGNQIPSYTDRVRLSAFRGKSFTLPSARSVNHFFDGSDFLTVEGLALLAQEDDLGGDSWLGSWQVDRSLESAVDYIVLKAHKPLNFQLSSLPSMFSRVYANGDYVVYSVAPELQPGHAIIANTYLVQESWSEAATEYRMALRLNPNDALAHFGLARVYETQGEMGQAIAEYGKAFSIVPVASDSSVLRGISQKVGIDLEYLPAYLALGESYEMPRGNNLQDATYEAHDFLNHLESNPNSDRHVRRSVFVVGGEPRGVLFQHPPSEVGYVLDISAPAYLSLSLALSPEVWQPGRGDGVQFDITIDNGHTLFYPFSEYIDPKNAPAHRQWHDREIDLSPWAGQTITFTFSNGCGPNNDCRYDWAGWGEPRIVQPIAYNFLAELPSANHSTTNEKQVRQDTLIIDYEPRAILFQHPSSQVIYRVDVPERAGLHFGLGMEPTTWSPDKGDGVEYNVYVRYPDDPYTLYRVFHHYLDPKHNPDDRHWLDQVVDLSTYGEQTVDIIFEALPGSADDANFDWGGWSTPVLVADDMTLLNPDTQVVVWVGDDRP